MPFSTLRHLFPMLVMLGAPPALAWNSAGHRTITSLALDGLGPDMPAFLREPDWAARIADESNEPDRWRGTRVAALSHAASPEHYLDAEELAPFGLTMGTIPTLRYDYVATLAIARHEHPDRFEPIDASRDWDRTRQWPGFLPYAMNEGYARLRSSFTTLRILTSLPAPDGEGAHARELQIIQARENIVHEMGLLSHYVGDGAQPLHLTIHHHGWVGDNPDGYTTDAGFHAYIDGAILEIHKLDLALLRPGMVYDAKVNAADPWADEIAYLERSFALVEPLYKLQHSGDLEKDHGREFIATRLRDAGSMLAAMYRGAWDASAPTEEQVAGFLRYEGKAVPAPVLGR